MSVQNTRSLSPSFDEEPVFDDQALWVVDEAPVGRHGMDRRGVGATMVRLLRIDVTSGATTSLGVWTRRSSSVRTYLSAAGDGSVLLATTHLGHGRDPSTYLTARITLDRGRPHMHLGATAPGELLAPPVVDERGTGYLVRHVDGDVSLVRGAGPTRGGAEEDDDDGGGHGGRGDAPENKCKSLF